MARRKPAPCPCGGATLADCCGPLHDGARAATDAAALMRSRYSAYALGLTDYLLATWHPDTRPATLALDPSMKWIGLAVEDARSQDPDHATVRFTARYRAGGRAGRLHENSRFERIDGRWFYRDGDVDETPPAAGPR
ncbi:MAG: hypothetical protein KDG55_04575 [Rhodocyclaceae bacterium]|nr:hypothetical protein [Rhodocyclaceae bacterium]